MSYALTGKSPTTPPCTPHPRRSTRRATWAPRQRRTRGPSRSGSGGACAPAGRWRTCRSGCPWPGRWRPSTSASPAMRTARRSSRSWSIARDLSRMFFSQSFRGFQGFFFGMHGTATAIDGLVPSIPPITHRSVFRRSVCIASPYLPSIP